MTLEERILKHTKKTESCWYWQGSRDLNNHAHLSYNYKRYSVHRVMYELAGNALDKNTLLQNTCGTKHCVNPNHWKIYSVRGNIEKDKTGASLSNSG